MAVEVFMPKMTDHAETGEIIRWLVKEGDRVEQGQVIMEVMTDKVVAELESPASGILKGIRSVADDGAIIPVGVTFAFIAESDKQVPVLLPLTPAGGAGGTREAGMSAAPAAAPVAEPTQPGPGQVRTTPIARRLAKELGVDLSLVKGSGSDGRIKEEDVRAFAAQGDRTQEEYGRIRLYPQINVGVAVGTDEGLVVPVVKAADQKSLAQVAQEVKAFQDKAQRMRFTNEDLSGGTFTISNLGMYGIDQFNAIINPPQSAILAVGRVIKTPIGMPDDAVALRPMMTMTLTVDHRVMDGINGAKFLAEIKGRIERPYFLL